MADKENKLDEALESADQILNDDDDFLDEFGESNAPAARKAESAGDADHDRAPNRELEDMSPAELREEIQKDKKKAARSLVFALTALIAIIAICIAWFVANNVINGGTGDVSAGTDSRFEIASKGVRQEAETTYFLKDDDTLKLGAGTPREFDSYYDIELQTTVTSATDAEDADKTYNLGQSGIAWFQDGQTLVEPGASGKLEFYVLPKKSGLTQMTITLKTEAYYKKHPTLSGSDGQDEAADPGNSDNNTSKAKAARSDKEVLQNLVEGHILLFRHVDSAKGYSGWLEPENVGGDDVDEAGKDGYVFTITADEAGVKQAGDSGKAEFEAETLYKVTVYWVWPKYFRNYIYNTVDRIGDLFADTTPSNEDYTRLLEFVNGQKEMGISGGSKLFYSRDNTIKVVTDKNIDSSMVQETLDTCSQYYNNADEYIGTNADFLYISATVD